MRGITRSQVHRHPHENKSKYYTDFSNAIAPFPRPDCGIFKQTMTLIEAGLISLTMKLRWREEQVKAQYSTNQQAITEKETSGEGSIKSKSSSGKSVSKPDRRGIKKKEKQEIMLWVH